MSLLRLNPTLRALTRAVTRPSAPFVTRSILNRAGISSANVIGRHYASNPKPKSCHAKIKHPAPVWEANAVINGNIRNLSHLDFANKYLVLLFFPLNFTFVCPTELIAFSDRIEEFQELNAEVVGVSVDSEYSHLAWSNLPRDQGGISNIRIPLVSDIKKEISTAYGVLFEEKGFAFRGLFIIDDLGLLRVSQIYDTEIGRSVDETLRLIQAIQHANTYGEVCPANWKRGSPAIKPNPRDSKEYFEKQGR
ncbi:703_t:CDS:10 [Paraglomus brasilianum]|uniref:thioredoxin-dependent peroxiredoxin n=1 Tax=Paraglomus brasilianum TaxID=144538 RepID=A0A9N9FCG6_9GLOM|nr:703_t:CDS:10 [Paraglomus brasilianum]